MTAVEIIDEIKHLAPQEQARVITFVRALDGAQQLTGRELADLAGALAGSSNTAEAEALKARIAAGFYGEPRHA